jgi:hypothetical protein
VTTVHEDGAWELARSTLGYDMYCLSISQALGIRQCLHFFTNRCHYARYLLSRGYLSARTISRADTSTMISIVLGDICQNYLVPGWLDQYSHCTWLLGVAMIIITRQNKIHMEMKVISLMGSNDHLSSHPSKIINWHMLERTLLFNYDELWT